MTKIKSLVVRVTNTQHEIVKNNAQINGYKTLANYVRTKALESDRNYERKIDEIYNKIVGTEPMKKRKWKYVPLTDFIEN